MPDVIHDICPVTWPLEDPGPEDLANGINHGCILEAGHEGNHRCGGCGHQKFNPEAVK